MAPTAPFNCEELPAARTAEPLTDALPPPASRVSGPANSGRCVRVVVASGVALAVPVDEPVALWLAVPVDEPVPLLLLVSELLETDVAVSDWDGEVESVKPVLLLPDDVRFEVCEDVPERVIVPLPVRLPVVVIVGDVPADTVVVRDGDTVTHMPLQLKHVELPGTTPER